MSITSASATSILTSYFTLDVSNYQPNAAVSAGSNQLVSVDVSSTGALTMTLPTTKTTVTGSLPFPLSSIPHVLNLVYDQLPGLLSVYADGGNMPLLYLTGVNLANELASSVGYFSISSYPSQVASTWDQLTAQNIALKLVPLSSSNSVITTALPVSVPAGNPVTVQVNVENICGRSALYPGITISGRIVNDKGYAITGSAVKSSHATSSTGIAFTPVMAGIYTMSVQTNGVDIGNRYTYYVLYLITL